MFTFKVSEYTANFGDSQCIKYMEGLLCSNGAPNIPCCVDFENTTLTPGSICVIMCTLKHLNCTCINLNKKYEDIKNRIDKYEIHNYLEFDEFIDKLSLCEGQYYILSYDTFTVKEEQHICKILNIDNNKITTRVYYRAYFNTESREHKFTIESFMYNQFYNGEPNILKPTEEDLEFIHKVLD